MEVDAPPPPDSDSTTTRINEDETKSDNEHTNIIDIDATSPFLTTSAFGLSIPGSVIRTLGERGFLDNRLIQESQFPLTLVPATQHLLLCTDTFVHSSLAYYHLWEVDYTPMDKILRLNYDAKHSIETPINEVIDGGLFVFDWPMTDDGFVFLGMLSELDTKIRYYANTQKVTHPNVEMYPAYYYRHSFMSELFCVDSASVYTNLPVLRGLLFSYECCMLGLNHTPLLCMTIPVFKNENIRILSIFAIQISSSNSPFTLHTIS